MNPDKRNHRAFQIFFNKLTIFQKTIRSLQRVNINFTIYAFKINDIFHSVFCFPDNDFYKRNTLLFFPSCLTLFSDMPETVLDKEAFSKILPGLHQIAAAHIPHDLKYKSVVHPHLFSE